MNITATGIEEIEKKIKGLSLRMQEKLLNKVSNKIVENSKKRIASQTDLNDQAFKPRSKNTNKQTKKRMLMGLMRKLAVIDIRGNTALIGFTGNTGRIAYKQQFGDKSKTFKHSGGNAAPATKRQALELRKLGFKIGHKKPTIKTIISKYTISQAGFVIRKLRAWHGIPTKVGWYTSIPARSFLGITERDSKELIQLMNDEINKELNG